MLIGRWSISSNAAAMANNLGERDHLVDVGGDRSPAYVFQYLYAVEQFADRMLQRLLDWRVFVPKVLLYFPLFQ